MYRGPVIDIDVHHQPRIDSELLPYVPQRSHELASHMVANGIALDARRAFPVMPHGPDRLDAVASDGSRPGSSYEMLREQILDAWDLRRCLLTYNVGEYGTHSNPYLSTDLCVAANDWNIEQWLSRDDRLYSGIVVSGMLPDEARAEVGRLAGHPRMSCVIIGGNPLGRPLGDPLYHPIYEAAAEADLAVVVHIGLSAPQSARAIAGAASTASEMGSTFAMAGSQILSSFIAHGVFEKFPNLRLVMNEFGLSWLPPLIWSLDRDYSLLRRESPWVHKYPSEYVLEHVKLSTQPLETTTDGRSLVEFLGALDGIEELLCFSSDYPHYTMDDFAFAARVIPKAWHRKIFFENARDVFRWHDVSAEQGVLAGVGA